MKLRADCKAEQGGEVLAPRLPRCAARRTGRCRSGRSGGSCSASTPATCSSERADVRGSTATRPAALRRKVWAGKTDATLRVPVRRLRIPVRGDPAATPTRQSSAASRAAGRCASCSRRPQSSSRVPAGISRTTRRKGMKDPSGADSTDTKGSRRLRSRRERPRATRAPRRPRAKTGSASPPRRGAGRLRAVMTPRPRRALSWPCAERVRSRPLDPGRS